MSTVITTTMTTTSPPKKSVSSSSSLISVVKLKDSNSSRRSNPSLGSSSPRISSSKIVAEQRSKARDIVQTLQRKQIKLVAIDFDNTLLAIHTSGYYQGTAENLLDDIRPTFHYLIQELLDSPAFGQTLHVCIVSFSSQEQLIRKLLRLAFRTSKTDRIIIRCNTVEFVSNISEDDFLGKEYHLTSVLTEIANRRSKTIKPQEILLLDDDVQNIMIAEEFGHRALEVRDEISLDIIKEYVLDFLPDN